MRYILYNIYIYIYIMYAILNLQCHKCARMRLHCANGLVLLRTCTVAHLRTLASNIDSRDDGDELFAFNMYLILVIACRLSVWTNATSSKINLPRSDEQLYPFPEELSPSRILRFWLRCRFGSLGLVCKNTWSCCGSSRSHPTSFFVSHILSHHTAFQNAI